MVASPPSSPSDDADRMISGMIFVDCLTIIDRLLPDSVSEQETIVKSVSSLEQLLKRSTAATRHFRCLKETDLVSSVLNKSLPLHKDPVS
jgi:hypothetical protein